MRFERSRGIKLVDGSVCGKIRLIALLLKLPCSSERAERSHVRFSCRFVVLSLIKCGLAVWPSTINLSFGLVVSLLVAFASVPLRVEKLLRLLRKCSTFRMWTRGDEICLLRNKERERRITADWI